MSDDSGPLRSVAWGEIFPWLMILRALRLSTGAPVLFLATVGTLLMPLGWWGAAFVLPESHRADSTRSVMDDFVPSLMELDKNRIPQPTISISGQWSDLYVPMASVVTQLVAPLRPLGRLDASWPELIYYGLGGFWNLLVWALFGGAITRIAVMRFGRQEREGMFDAFRFAGRRLLGFVGAPLFALSGVILVMALSYPAGWLMRWDVGVLLTSLVWIFVLLGGLIITILVIGVLIGWPLMWGALSAEEMGDMFEGAQRSFSYGYGRPLHYAFYALVTVVSGSLVFCVVRAFAQMVVYFSFWAVSWGSGLEPLTGDVTTGHAGAMIGMSIISGLNALVLTVAAAFRYGFIWSAAGVIYLLLRRDSDQIEYDNVFVQDEQTRYGLPPLTTDEAGVAGVGEETPH